MAQSPTNASKCLWHSQHTASLLWATRKTNLLHPKSCWFDTSLTYFAKQTTQPPLSLMTRITLRILYVMPLIFQSLHRNSLSTSPNLCTILNGSARNAASLAHFHYSKSRAKWSQNCVHTIFGSTPPVSNVTRLKGVDFSCTRTRMLPNTKTFDMFSILLWMLTSQNYLPMNMISHRKLWQSQTMASVCLQKYSCCAHLHASPAPSKGSSLRCMHPLAQPT